MVMDYTPPKVGEPPEMQPAKCRRIEIPIEPYDDMLMRDVAEALRQLAYKLEYWAKVDRETREKKIMSVAEIDHLNSQIRHLAETKGYFWRAGRPKASESLAGNPNETPPKLQLLKPALRLHPDSAGP